MTYANHFDKYDFRNKFVKQAETNNGEAIHHWKHPITKAANTGTSIIGLVSKHMGKSGKIDAQWCAQLEQQLAQARQTDELSSLSE
jgi:hypothetical protein